MRMLRATGVCADWAMPSGLCLLRFLRQLTLILDPIFIFTFGWGIQGAAAANAISDLVALLLGLHGLVYVHKFIGHFSFAGLKRDFKDVSAIAFPSILTQLATPFATAYMTYIVASFGNDVVTASAIVGRLVPVAFGVVFSLSGSVGPIIGQNYGAKNFERVRQALTDGMKFGFIYTLITSAILFLLRNRIADAFSANGRTTELVVFFATYVAVSWAFVGMLFVANAAFNNLGRASYSTWTNWGRATLGTIPFAIIGKAYWGAEGVMAATAIGAVIFGIAAALIAFRTVGHLEGKHTSLAPA